MSNGNRSAFPLYNAEPGWKEVKIQPEGAIVKKIIMYGRTNCQFGGVQFFDSYGNKILEAGSLEKQAIKEIILKDGERLIGIKANEHNKTTYKNDLQFVIGWLE